MVRVRDVSRILWSKVSLRQVLSTWAIMVGLSQHSCIPSGWKHSSLYLWDSWFGESSASPAIKAGVCHKADNFVFASLSSNSVPLPGTGDRGFLPFSQHSQQKSLMPVLWGKAWGRRGDFLTLSQGQRVLVPTIYLRWEQKLSFLGPYPVAYNLWFL